MYETIISSAIDDVALANLSNFYNTIHANEVKQIAKGDGIKVAVLDSGVDFMHTKLINRVHGLYNVLNGSEDFCRDRLGHGTYISGLICGIDIGLVQNITHYVIKVTDDYGNMNTKTIVDGIRWAINNNVDVICMAFGTKTYDPELAENIRLAYEAGIIMIASAGNDPNVIEYPAKFPQVLCVGSIDYSLQRAQFSAVGAELDIVLPGIDVPSLYSYGRYAISSGSSPSTAIATGIIVMLQHLRMKQRGVKFNLFQIKRWLSENTIDLGEVGYDSQYGLGVPTFSRLKEHNFDITYF